MQSEVTPNMVLFLRRLCCWGQTRQESPLCEPLGETRRLDSVSPALAEGACAVPPEDSRRWLAAVGLLADPAASVRALLRPRQPRPADLDRRGRPAPHAPVLRLAFREDILSGLDAVVGLHRRLFSQPLELSPQRPMGRRPYPGQRRRGV
jgi:Tfp pilus assembly protein FimV